MKIAMAILNYGRLRTSCQVARCFVEIGLPTQVVTSAAPHDPPRAQLRSEFPDIAIDQRPGSSDFYGGKFIRGSQQMLAGGSEVLGWMACDCEVSNPGALVERVRRAFERLPKLGVYMPNCRWTYWLYEKEEAPVVDGELELCETPMLDSTCWFARRDVAAPLVDPIHEIDPNYGWGIVTSSTWVAHTLGYRWGRDYGILLRHEKSTGNNVRDAKMAQQPYFASFGKEAVSWMEQRQALGRQYAEVLCGLQQ